MQIQNKFIIIVIFILIYIFSCEEGFTQVLLKGKITSSIQKGNSLEINLATPLSSHFTLEGDEVIGYINEDINTSGILIPKGSIIKGIVKKIIEPKHLGIDGSFEVEFNELKIGKAVIPIHAIAGSGSKSFSDSSSKILTYDVALITYGAFNGALAGFQYGGIPLAITSHGISVLAGTGIGTGAGIIGSLIRKGDLPSTSYGKSSKFILLSDLYFLGEPDNKGQDTSQNISNKSLNSEYKGFRFNKPISQNKISITIIGIKKMHDKKLGEYISIELEVENNTNKSISLSNLKLKSNKNEFLDPDLLLSGGEVIKSIKPHEKYKTNLAFLIQDKKEKYNISFIDPLDNIEVYTLPLKLY